MQPYISQALVATRIAEMDRRAEIAQLARGEARPATARIQPVGGAQPARRPERVGLPAV